MTEHPGIVRTERDYACAQTLLARVDDPEPTLPNLTDGAIVALDGTGREQMGALSGLWENAGTAENRELVDSSGRHSFALTARSAGPSHIMDLANAAVLVSADGQDILGVPSIAEPVEKGLS